MARIQPQARVLLQYPQSVYGYSLSPGYSYRARARVDEARHWALDGLTLVEDAGLVMLTPRCNAANSRHPLTCTGTNTAGTLAWSTVADPKHGGTMHYQSDTGTAVQWTAVSGTSVGQFYLDMWLSNPAMSGTRVVGDVLIDYPAGNSTRYNISVSPDQPLTIRHTTDSGTTYKLIGQSNQPADSGFAAWLRLMLASAGPYVIFGVNDEPWIVHHNPSSTLTGSVSIEGYGLGAGIQLSPIAYGTAGTGVASSIPVSRPVDAVPKISLRGYKATDTDYTGTITDYNSNEFSYEFSLTSDGSQTPALTSVTVDYAPLLSAVTQGGATVVPSVRAVNESIRFDPNTLNIYTDAQIVCDNHNGQFSSLSGVRACELDLGYVHTGLFRRMTGLAGHTMQWSTQPKDQTFVLSMSDRSIQLRQPSGAMVVNMPYMDGWCIHRAMRYLANYGGISDEWLGFPICDGDVDNPCGHYLLPFGDVFHPLVKFQGGMYVWECMQRLQQYVGYILYFDAAGVLRFYPWVPSQPGFFKKQFTLVGDSDWYGNPQLNEMFSVARTRDMTSVRNDVTIVGIDPETWKPIVAHNRDNDSISNPLAQNYLGYRAPMVWADSMFVSTDYASQALDAVFNVARLPNDSVQLNGWMQPDLYPLDVIGVYDPFSEYSNKPYWIREINNSVSIGADMVAVPNCSISAQWLTPWG